MPTDDVSDLRDVVDAINRLCETMKTSDYGDIDDNNEIELCEDVEVKVESEVELVSPEQILVCEVETYVAELWSDAASLQVDSVDSTADTGAQVDTVSTLALDTLTKSEVETAASNRSSRVEPIENLPLNSSLKRDRNIDNVGLDSNVTRIENVNIVANNQPVSKVESVVSVASDPVVFDQEAITASFEPASEMYYTASSEVSLLSEAELPDRVLEDGTEGRDALTKDDRNGVMAGHVAAMRERFESMTRANTPCPDVMRSVSPSLDVYRNITPSPDHLG